jgi:hypothetical protein
MICTCILIYSFLRHCRPIKDDEIKPQLSHDNMKDEVLLLGTSLNTGITVPTCQPYRINAIDTQYRNVSSIPIPSFDTVDIVDVYNTDIQCYNSMDNTQIRIKMDSSEKTHNTQLSQLEQTITDDTIHDDEMSNINDIKLDPYLLITQDPTNNYSYTV